MLKRLLNNILHKVTSNPSFLKMAEQLPINLGKRPAEADYNLENSKKRKKKQQHRLGETEGHKRKIALLAAYNGAGYYGVQVNPGFPTIESELFPALVKIGAVPQDHAENPSKMWFQRGSRTDKGVSAVGQVFSLKAILVPDFVNKLNEVLPQQIRVMGYVRTTNGFDSKNWCNSRTYTYTLPTFAFAPIEKFITEDYRTTPEILEQVRSVVKKFLGTHKFHNFTSGVKYEEARAARYIIKFECSDPYIREGLEFVTFEVKGQSFMLHHIRKMIGITIAVVRGYCGESVIDAAWGPDKVDIPKAPGLGLVLETLHLDDYNKRYGKDGVHAPIDWSPYQDLLQKFREEQIISQIISQEKTEKVMFNWLRTLQFHNFGQGRAEDAERPWRKLKDLLAAKDAEEKDSRSTNTQLVAADSSETVNSENQTENSQIKTIQPENILQEQADVASVAIFVASAECRLNPDTSKDSLDLATVLPCENLIKEDTNEPPLEESETTQLRESEFVSSGQNHVELNGSDTSEETQDNRTKTAQSLP